MSTLRVHAMNPRTLVWLCGQQGGKQPAEFANGNVTCRVCLYRLGLYVPLSKLRYHQQQDPNYWPDIDARSRIARIKQFAGHTVQCVGCGFARQPFTRCPQCGLAGGKP